jgi:GTP-binding protein
MFCDQTKIVLKAGKGGDGLISFRREKYKPKGGPDGGNGGNGGDIILVANENLNSLIHLHTRKFFKAENGQAGSGNNRTGRTGSDLEIEVPVGTQVFARDSGELIMDFAEHNQAAVIAVGGRGGYGNAHFKSSVRQAPRFAELGEPGEEREVDLELKLVADVGIIGLPSAGKSTLISVLSDARPKIGDFPFTTIVPNLGVAKLDGQNSLVFCDIPGLISGAHAGKGLGHQFLRHVARNRALIHLVAADSPQIIEDLKIIHEELEKFDSDLTRIPEIIAISKSDLLEDSELKKKIALIKRAFSGREVLAISALTKKGTKELMLKAFELVQKLKSADQEELVASSRIVLRPHLEKRTSKRFEIFKLDSGVYQIIGPRIEQIAIMTDYSNSEGVFRLRDVLRKMGIEKELIRIGAERGDKLLFGQQLSGLDFLPQIT